MHSPQKQHDFSFFDDLPVTPRRINVDLVNCLRGRSVLFYIILDFIIEKIKKNKKEKEKNGW